MPELDPLPQRPRVPVFAPRTGDYAAVVGRAHHRRRRHLASAGAGVAGVAVLVALTTGGAAGSFGLDPVQPAKGIEAPEESPVPGESPTPEPSEEPTAGPGESEEPGENGGPEESPEPQEEPRPSESDVVIDPGPGGDDPPPPARKPYVLREDVPMQTAQCETDAGPAAAAGWCFRYEGLASVRAGEVHPYRMSVCRHLGRGTGTLKFAGEQQVDFVVQGNGRDEWRWSGGYEFGKAPTEVKVAESRCVRWTVTWDGTDDFGEHVRPGQYQMSPDLKVTDWGDAIGGSTSYGFGYPLEVTE
ncbi:MAG TPA: BsuPI-related putative proteinase inhibitor [Frankiaceae bacterium]|nr:BsuPI-related putative proteinase inhibitor [Frankiaceae bacterium]